jgi:hypothetical protein
VGAAEAGFDWVAYVKEGGAWCAPLLLMAIYWLNTERARLLEEVKIRDEKLEELSDKALTVMTELKTFLFTERRT